MKIRTLAVASLLLVSASLAMADHNTPAVLTNEGAVYTVAPLPANQLELVLRVGETRETILVPSTDDAAVETVAQLAYDSATSTLFVVWHSGDSVYASRRFGDGTWSDPLQIVAGRDQRAALEVAITRVATTTLLHAAWWTLGAQPVAEYALVAFESNEYVSGWVTDLVSLAPVNSASDLEASEDIEVVSEVLHPPLAMARASSSSIDIVFGESKSTRLTRIVLEPKLRADVRIWKPGRRGGKPMPRAGLNSANGEPVQVILNQGRVILYSPEDNFRFVIYENGQWSPERMIKLDEQLTREQLIEQLRKTVESLEIDETPAEEDSVNE